MGTDVPAVGKTISCRVDADLYDDLSVVLQRGLNVSDAIKYGIAALAMRLRTQAPDLPSTCKTPVYDKEAGSV
jgi:hypothetical protein